MFWSTRLSVSIVAGVLLVGLSGCVDMPDLSDRIAVQSEDGDFPSILPIGPLLDGPAPLATDDVRNALRDRADALKKRGAPLRKIKPSKASDLNKRAQSLSQKAEALRAL